MRYMDDVTERVVDELDRPPSIVVAVYPETVDGDARDTLEEVRKDSEGTGP
jgi:hypothetical protein